MLPLPSYHGLPLGQIFCLNLSAKGFKAALNQMVPHLVAELEFVSHPWFCCWLNLVKANLPAFVMDWVACNDIQDSLVLQDTDSGSS